MSYRNQHLLPNDPEFKEKYKSVIDAHVQLEMHGEVEVEFSTYNGMIVWRRRCYEYQKITGKTFRIEQLSGYSLLLRPRTRLPVGDYGLVNIKPIRTTDERTTEESRLPDADGVVVSEADLELARRILKKVKKEEAESDPIAILKKEGADDRRPESGGDAADTGSSRRDD